MNTLPLLGWIFFTIVVLGGITSVIARSKNRDSLGWFFFGGLFFIVALPILLLSKPGMSARNAPSKGCPYCGATMPSSERACPSCGRSQPVTAASSQKNWEEMIAHENDL